MTWAGYLFPPDLERSGRATYQVKVNNVDVSTVFSTNSSRANLRAGTNTIEIIVTPGYVGSQTKTYTININRVPSVVTVGYEFDNYVSSKRMGSVASCVIIFEPDSGVTPARFTLQSFIEGGTAIAGVDYTDPGDVLLEFNEGDSRQCITISFENTPGIAKTIFLGLALVSSDPSIAVSLSQEQLGGILIRGNDATLRELSLSDTATSAAIVLSPAFASSTITYSAYAANSVTSLDISAVVNDMGGVSVYRSEQSAAATYEVQVNGASSGNTVNLAVGANVVEIIVTPGDKRSQTKTYTINIDRVPLAVTVGYEFLNYQSTYEMGSSTHCAIIYEPASGAPARFELSVSSGGGTAIPGDDYHPVQDERLVFNEGERRQCHTVGFINNPPDRAKYFLTTLSLVSHDPSIVVTLDPSATAAIIWGNDATLRELSLSDADTSAAIALSPAFASSTITYTADVADSITSLDVRAVVNDTITRIEFQGSGATSEGATYQVQVNGVSSGDTVNLRAGINTIEIVVTSDQSQQIKTYTINVNQLLSSDANLSALSIAGVTLSPAFTSSALIYSTNVANDRRSVDIRLVANHAQAVITRNGNIVSSGVDTVNINVGMNIFSYLVTAGDGSTIEYTLTVSREVGPSIANAGPDQTVFSDGTRVTLDGRDSISEGGTTLSYGWSQSSGEEVSDFTDTDTFTPSFIPSELPSSYTLEFTLVVTDVLGSSSDVVVVTVLPEVRVGYEDNNTASESSGGAELCATLLYPPDGTPATFTLSASTIDNTALAGVDYVARADVRLTFNQGDTRQCYTVSIIDDDIAEAEKEFIATLSVVDDGGYRVSITTPEGRLTTANIRVIINDDDALLDDLVVLGGATLSPAFNPITMTYALTVPSHIESISMIPSSQFSDIMRDGVAISGGSADTVALNTGTNIITYILTPATGAEHEVAYTLTILRVANSAPVVVVDNQTLSFPENGTTTLATYSAVDDEGDPITWSITSNREDADVNNDDVDARAFAIDINGMLSFRAPPNFEDLNTVAGGNTYEITLTASDDSGATSTLSTLDIEVSVLNVNEPGVVSLLFVSSDTQVRVGLELIAELSDPDSVTNPIFSWQSSSNGIDYTAIDGATSARYTLTEEDIGKTLRVLVTYDDSTGSDRVAISAPTVAVASADAIDAPILTLIEDSGISNIDAITDDGQITLTLAEGATWEYTVNGRDFLAGEGSSFILAEGVYTSGQVQARQTLGGEQSAVSSFGAITVDSTAPFITSITSNSPDGTYKAGDNISIIITLSEETVGEERFTGVFSSGVSFFVTRDANNPLVFSGIYTVRAVDDDDNPDVMDLTDTLNTTPTDRAGNELNYTTPTANNLSDNTNIRFDSTPPTIISVFSNSPDGSYKAGDDISITVVFSEALSDESQLAVVILDTRLILVKGEHPNTLVATYSVTEGVNSDDLSLVVQSDLAPMDVVGNEMTDFTIPAGQNLAGNRDIIIDTITPTVTFATLPELFVAREASLDFSLSEQLVRDLNVNDFSVTNIRGALGFSGTGQNYTLTFTPDTAGDLSISFHGGVADEAGNVIESALITARAEPSVPSAPIDLTGSASNGQVTLSWQLPEEDGGADISAYQYRQRLEGEAFVDTLGGANGWQDFTSNLNARTQTLTGLTNGVEYFFEVRAINVAGGSLASREVGLQPFLSTIDPSDIRLTIARQSPASIAADGVAIVSEGDTQLFTVRLSGPLPYALLVPVGVSNAESVGTGAGAVYGTSDNDYTVSGFDTSCATITAPATGTFICLPAGATSRGVVVTITGGGGTYENPETFMISLYAEPVSPEGEAQVLRSIITADREISTLIKGGPINFNFLTNLFVFPENRQSALVFVIRRTTGLDLGRIFKGRTDTGTDRTLTSKGSPGAT